MTVYRIDYNRGSDTNDGVSAPWQNLSQLAAQVLSSGDSILLAADSDWSLTAHINIAASWTGTRGSPVTIGRYFPASVNTGRPRISRRRAIAANEWTYDAGSNAWYVQWFSPDVGVGSYIKLGGAFGFCQEAALPLVSADGAWRNGVTGVSGTNGRVYVYAPAGTNPTDYYGSVYFAPESRGTFSFGSTGNYVVIEDIDAYEGGGLVWAYSQSGTRQFVVRRCGLHAVGAGVVQFCEVSGSLSLLVDDCDSSGGISYYVKSYSADGAGFGGLEVCNSRFNGGGVGWSNGNVYMQARGVGVSRVHGNTFDGAPYGSGFTTLDGAAIYAEFGADNVYVSNNVVSNCHNALTDNTGRRTTWTGNLIIDCYSTMKCDDFSEVGSTNHRFFNNSVIRAGAPVDPAGPSRVPGIGWWSYINGAFDLRNNLFTKHPSARAAAAIEVGTGATGTISHNSQHGFSAMAENYQGGASPIGATNTVTADPLLDSSFRLTAASPCRGAGVYIPGARHFGGAKQNIPADIGAYRYFEPREIVTERELRRYA